MALLDGVSWMALTNLIAFVSLCFSIPINLLLLFCILKKSPKAFGGYKILMIWFSVQGIFFSNIAAYTHMCFHTIDGTFMMFTISNSWNLPPFVIWILLGLCCISVGFVLLSLAMQFVYRYFAMSNKNNLKYFRGWRRLYFVLMMIIVAVVYGGCGFVGINLTPERDREIRESMAVAYNVTPEQVYYVAVEYYVRDALNHKVINWTSMGTATVLNLLFSVMVFVIIYCGIKTYKGTQVETVNLSNHMKIQRALFTALLVQTATPTILIFIPCIIFYSLPVFGIPLGTDANALSVSLVLDPIFDPLGVMFIIVQYRRFLKKAVRCRCARKWIFVRLGATSAPAPQVSSETIDSQRFHNIQS